MLKCSLLAAVVGLVLATPLLFHRVDEEVRRRLERRLGEVHPDLQVSVRSAALVPGKGIEARGISLREPGIEGTRGELLHIEEAFFSCTTQVEELVKGEPEITRIYLRRPTLRATHRPDGSWSAARLIPDPRVRHITAEVRVESGRVEVSDASRNPSGALTLREVNLTVLAPEASPARGGSPTARRFEGTSAGDLLQLVEVSGQIDPEQRTWSLAGSLEGLEVSPELRDALPAQWSQKAAALGTFRAQADIRFSAGYDGQGEAPLRFEVTGQVTQGRLEDPRLPHALSAIRAAFTCNNEGVRIDNLSARAGPSTLHLSYHRTGLGDGCPCTLKAEVRDVELDRQLVDLLPESLQAQWFKYLPAGQVSADARLVFDGQTWTPEVTLQCLNTSFTYYKFPYRLERATGQIELKGDVLEANLTGYSGNRPVRITAHVVHPQNEPQSYGWMEAKTDSLPIDEKLLSAVPETGRKILRALDPRGTIHARFRVAREQPGEPPRRHLVVGLNRCGIRYERFAYPIGNIVGTMELHDDRWSFRDLEGTNDTARITCSGYLTPTPQGHELRLWLAGTCIPLEQELREALHPAMQQVWDTLRPQGSVDLVRAEVGYATDQGKLEVSLRARPRSENTSIQPVNFPYRMEKLSGELDYRDGLVTVEQLKAEHGNVRMSADGFCEFDPSGAWRLVLKKLAVDRLRVDRELIQALPGRLKKLLVGLDPKGAINLHGGLALGRESLPNAPLTSSWDLGLEFQQAAIDCGIPLENMDGGLRLAGGYDGERFTCRGELAVDSLTYKDFQFTQVGGPLWIDDQRVLLGSWVDRPMPGPSAAVPAEGERKPRPLTAQLFGGTVQADGWVALAETPRFDLHATLSDGELAKLAQEVVSGHQNLRGKIAAVVDLRGSGRSLNGLGGRGSIRLRDGDVYELPLMISLLKILSVRQPDRKAFSTSDIDFRIEGKNIYLDRMEFNGDVVSLKGQGEMNFQSELKLTFHALVGRGDNLPLLQQVLGGASQQLMQIRVGGTLQKPETVREAFPVVNQALQQFQADGPQQRR